MTTSGACLPPQPPALVEQPIHNSQLQTAITPRFVVCLELAFSLEIASGDRGQAPRNAPQQPQQPLQFIDGACAPQCYGLMVSSSIALTRWRAAPRSQSVDSLTLGSHATSTHTPPTLSTVQPPWALKLAGPPFTSSRSPATIVRAASSTGLCPALRTQSHKHRLASNQCFTTS